MRIIQQYAISSSDLVLADKLLRSFAHDFEILYYQRRESRLHFCRQSVHALLHLASEVTRIGPPICSSQWTMERTIGNLGEEIRQPSNPFANLSQRGLLRCQVNALTAMVPILKPYVCNLPRGAVDIGDNYILLRAKDRYCRDMRQVELAALKVYLQGLPGSLTFSEDWSAKIFRWARLRLPNGQIARSRWKEALKPINKIRIARNVKVRLIFISDLFLDVFSCHCDFLSSLETTLSQLGRSCIIFSVAYKALCQRSLSSRFIIHLFLIS